MNQRWQTETWKKGNRIVLNYWELWLSTRVGKSIEFHGKTHPLSQYREHDVECLLNEKKRLTAAPNFDGPKKYFALYLEVEEHLGSLSP